MPKKNENAKKKDAKCDDILLNTEKCSVKVSMSGQTILIISVWGQSSNLCIKREQRGRET